MFNTFFTPNKPQTMGKVQNISYIKYTSEMDNVQNIFITNTPQTTDNVQHI